MPSIPSVAHDTYDIFKNNTLGQAYDLDGYPAGQPYQCWDFVDLLYQQADVGQYLYTAANLGGQGDGVKTCWTYIPARTRNGSGLFTAVAGVENIKKGDIIVLDEYSGWYGSTGHIGFADEDYNDTDYIRLLSQNFYGYNYVTLQQAYLGTAFLGIFRFTPWQSEPPVPPTPTERHKKFPWAIAWENWDGFKNN